MNHYSGSWPVSIGLRHPPRFGLIDSTTSPSLTFMESSMRRNKKIIVLNNEMVILLAKELQQ